MRLAAYIILTALLQVSCSGRDQTITFSGKDVLLKEIFAVIKTQTGVLFFYDAALLEDDKPIIVEWKNVTLKKALNEIFKDQPLTWVLEGNTVTVIKRPAQSQRKPD